MESTAYIAFGGNIDDRRAILERAVELLSWRRGVTVVKVSQLIETEPVGIPGQGKYLNGAAEIRTMLPPRELLAVLHEIEAELGRDRSKEQRWGPRTCDLDLLLYDGLVIDEPDFKLPHPMIAQRLFVLQPLAEIAPDLMHPVLHKTILELLNRHG